MENIDKYIEELKKVEPSPFLESRILASIENLNTQRESIVKKMPLWQSVAITICFALIVALGITIGNSYKSTNADYSGLMINDNHIEQLSLYQKYADE